MEPSKNLIIVGIPKKTVTSYYLPDRLN